ncbi:protein FLX-like 1 isoform X2 [Magnolia sinica]|uniref:protein FLX-like 1 isoform X2 n=1 Tax=Magnolia sinica TaxID=86752 RepID=UPI002659EBFA|nr:protein FLX-like 1 isoform X2 [Magnolia sinica]
MAGRNHLPSHHQVARDLPYGRAPHPLLLEDPRFHPYPARPHHPSLLEPRVPVHHHHPIQTLLVDNQRLAATHVALKQELSAAQLELRHLSAAASKIKAERDAQVREVYERSLKLEDEVRSTDAAAAELAQVRSDVQKLGSARQELAAQLQTLTGELARARTELQQVPTIKVEIETMQKELLRGRAAVEYEKKAHADNLEQSQAMEKNMISMAREVEKLRAELANAEKRARAAAAAAAAANPGPGYAGSYGNPEMGYGGSSYADAYGTYQVSAVADGGSQYGSGAVSHGAYDMQRTILHR